VLFHYQPVNYLLYSIIYRMQRSSLVIYLGKQFDR